MSAMITVAIAVTAAHEHNPEKIRREHIEEGIRDFRNCVECHRNANKHDIRGQSQEGGKDHERKKKHDDD
jgi:hypothetical protein